MARRKRKSDLPSPRNRIQVTDSEGWTHILKGAPPVQSSDAILSSLKNLSLDAQLTPADVATQQSRYASFWTESSCCRHLRSVIIDDIVCGSLELTQCVCLGLGSVVNGRQSPRHQLAALTWLHRLLRSHFPSLSEKIIFQDPAFTKSDIEYLESLGHQVVETPDAFKMMTRSSVLFAPHLERSVYAAALKTNQLPAICIGGNVRAFIEQVHFKSDDEDARKSDSEIFHRFETESAAKDLKEFECDPWWYCTKVYWRKGAGRPVD